MAYEQCTACSGSGQTSCSCGTGEQNCGTCGGSGRRWLNTGVWGSGHYEACTNCHGGKIRCYSCGGQRTLRCSRCGGSGGRHVADRPSIWAATPLKTASPFGAAAAPAADRPSRSRAPAPSRPSPRPRVWSAPLICAILGGVVAGAAANQASPGADPWPIVLVGALGGLLVPAVLRGVGLAIAGAFRLTLWLIRAALIAGLIAGVIYLIVRASSG